MISHALVTCQAVMREVSPFCAACNKLGWHGSNPKPKTRPTTSDGRCRWGTALLRPDSQPTWRTPLPIEFKEGNRKRGLTDITLAGATGVSARADMMRPPSATYRAPAKPGSLSPRESLSEAREV